MKVCAELPPKVKVLEEPGLTVRLERLTLPRASMLEVLKVKVPTPERAPTV